MRISLEIEVTDTRHVRAAILTIGNEIVAGDIENTNASWIARRLEQLGVKVALLAAVPDEIESIVEVVRRERGRVDHLIVTGGLGGTPDDLTREAIAAAYDVPQEVVPELAEDLRARFRGAPEYAARWAALPAGSTPLENPLGGAPGFRIANTWVLPGLPSEAMAMFDRYAGAFDSTERIGVWRRRLATRESELAPLLEEATARWPAVSVGSYPSFTAEGPEVEVVLKSTDTAALDEARRWLAEALDTLG